MKNYTDEQLKFITDETPFELPIVILNEAGNLQLVDNITDLRREGLMCKVIEQAESVFEAKGHSWDDEDWLEQMRKCVFTITYQAISPR